MAISEFIGDAMGLIGFLAGFFGFWGAVLLLFYVGAWFDRRGRLRPKPSSTPGLIALLVGAAFLPAEVCLVIWGLSYGLAMLQQLVLLAAVIGAWRWLARAERSWPLPSNNPVNADARIASEIGVNASPARAGYWER